MIAAGIFDSEAPSVTCHSCSVSTQPTPFTLFLSLFSSSAVLRSRERASTFCALPPLVCVLPLVVLHFDVTIHTLHDALCILVQLLIAVHSAVVCATLPCCTTRLAAEARASVFA